MRPTKNEYYMQIANVVKTRSHDIQTQAGGVLVKKDTGAIVATGYNGFIHGAADDKLPNTRPDKYPYMMHAEENIIAHCARHGISMEGCKIYLNFSPCVDCARLLWQCGVDIVIIESATATPSFKKYFEEIQQMKDLEVIINSTSEHYIELTLKPRTS